jgi:hypothetical protein
MHVENEQVTSDSPAETAGGKKKKGIGVNFKVSAKGAVSVYGLGRFPVTLYREQWLRLLEKTDDLKRFLDEHAADLKAKGEVEAAAPAAAAEPVAETAGTSTTPTGGAEGGEALAASEAAREAAPGPSTEVSAEAAPESVPGAEPAQAASESRDPE